ncbi:MAG: hypothetical protein LBI65_03350 [Candidatus Symbiothrix sp.]|jgi:hypothetical protein|nr:hypothetical protein [Candidatus Symbiothrix sp.]
MRTNPPPLALKNPDAMPDYSQHRPQDWEWYNEYRSRMGDEAFNKIFNAIYSFIREIPEGQFFDITKVKEENRDLFIKTSCLFVLEQRHYIGDLWSLSEDYTKFIHKNHV